MYLGTLVWGISSGDKKTRGYGKLAVEGLVQRCIYAWTASAPQFLPLIKENKIEATSSALLDFDLGINLNLILGLQSASWHHLSPHKGYRRWRTW